MLLTFRKNIFGETAKIVAYWMSWAWIAICANVSVVVMRTAGIIESQELVAHPKGAEATPINAVFAQY